MGIARESLKYRPNNPIKKKIPLTTPSSADVSKNMNPVSVICQKVKCSPLENRLL